jgi:hypothetical protein
MSIYLKLEAWLRRRRENQLLERWGGIQTCPWCRQCAQSEPGWGFTPYEGDLFLDVLTCGVCKGTSLWKFELGMFFVAPLNPPVPDTAVPWTHGHYDIAANTWTRIPPSPEMETCPS